MTSHVSRVWTVNMGYLLVAVIVGAIAGWLAHQLVPGIRLGLLGDTLVGTAGALIGALLFRPVHLHIGGGVIASIIAVTPGATIGAVILLLIARLIGRARTGKGP
jgi:uncharacterized membrane protein YeaQ/YmgE (transglycosylase-associated protein family)